MLRMLHAPPRRADMSTPPFLEMGVRRAEGVQEKLHRLRLRSETGPLSHRPMRNIAIIMTLLLGGYAVAFFSGAGPVLAGRIGICAVFVFTASGHFAKTDEMALMLPASVPLRRGIVRLSGVFELAVAAAILSREYRPAGLAICVFLLLTAPLNVRSAFRRVAFGGHALGPVYLAIRLPLQVLLLVWTWWFTLR